MKKKKVFIIFLYILFLSFILLSCKSKDSKPYHEPSLNKKQAIEFAVSEFRIKLENIEIFPKKMDKELIQFLQNNDVALGAAFAFVPEIIDGKIIRFAPYVFRKEGKYVSTVLPQDYDYTKDNWYIKPAKFRKAYWTKPYFDKGGANVWMVTCSAPIYSLVTKKFIGVLAVDLLLENKK